MSSVFMLMTEFSETSIFIEGNSYGRPVKVSTENKAIVTGIVLLEIVQLKLCMSVFVWKDDSVRVLAKHVLLWLNLASWFQSL